MNSGIVKSSAQNWLVIFNCQASGLGHCLRLLNSELGVEAYDSVEAAKNPKIFDRLSEFSLVIISPNVEKSLRSNIPDGVVVKRVPAFNFKGFHPDHINLVTDGSWVGGPMSGNHSAVCYGAFRAGLDVEAAISLFRHEVFQELGYLDQWHIYRNAFLQRYKDVELPLQDAFVRWSRMRGGFAYVPSHPKMQCLKDMAEALLIDAGLPVIRTDVLPHDNMANGVIFPIYPEIANSLGIAGDYNFKPSGGYRFFGLDDFIAKSYEFYSNCSDIIVPDIYQPLCNEISELITRVMPVGVRAGSLIP